jgi:hypothetical protein
MTIMQTKTERCSPGCAPLMKQRRSRCAGGRRARRQRAEARAQRASPNARLESGTRASPISVITLATRSFMPPANHKFARLKPCCQPSRSYLGKKTQDLPWYVPEVPLRCIRSRWRIILPTSRRVEVAPCSFVLQEVGAVNSIDHRMQRCGVWFLAALFDRMSNLNDTTTNIPQLVLFRVPWRPAWNLASQDGKRATAS